MSFDPVFDENSRILILGTYPSPASYSAGFYYGHPRNRFWPVLAKILECVPPLTVADKKQMLLKNKIAMWDVLDTCTIKGAADSTIKNGVPNNIGALLEISKINSVVVNGSTAAKLYCSYWEEKIQLPLYKMPSTSPANASLSFDKLLLHWVKIKDLLPD